MLAWLSDCMGASHRHLLLVSNTFPNRSSDFPDSLLAANRTAAMLLVRSHSWQLHLPVLPSCPEQVN